VTPVRVQTRSATISVVTSVAASMMAALALSACGTTYVDTSISVADTTTPTVAGDPADVADVADVADGADGAEDMSLAALLGEIEILMSDLDQRVVDGNGAEETMARIDVVWNAAESQIRAADPDDVFNFEQAIELARSGVERNRPADPSKGYKIFVDVADRYLAAR
jgi:hypothetical protein